MMNDYTLHHVYYISHHYLSPRCGLVTMIRTLGRAVVYYMFVPKRRQAAKMAACRWHNIYSLVQLLSCRSDIASGN